MFNKLIVQPIFNLLIILYGLIGDFGVAIILFTIIVKIVLTPLAKSQHRQTKKLRQLQPEIAKIKKKTAGNKQAEMLLTSSLYKANNIKASASFLSLIIQLPIMVAIFQVIRRIVENKDAIVEYSYSFVQKIDRIKQITDGQAVFKPTLFGLDLTQAPLALASWSSVVLLGFLIGQVFLQRKIMDLRNPAPTDEKGQKRRLRDVMREAQDGKEHDQSELNQITNSNMTKIMPFITVPILGFLYGAVSFYYFISNLCDFVQIKIFEREDLGEIKSVESQEVSERLKRAQSAQIINEQRMQKLKNRAKKTESSGVKITRIKAKKK